MNIQLFSKDFKQLISRYQNEIISFRQDSIKKYEEIRTDNKKILRQLLIVKVTKGFWREQPKIDGYEFFKKINKKNWTTSYFLEDEGKDILLKALKTYYRDVNVQYNNLKTYLF